MLQENTFDSVSVLTARDFVRSPSWKCIFDWEDEISALLGLPLDRLTKPSKLSRLLCDPKTFNYALPLLRRILNKSDNNIAIVYLMAPENVRFLLKSNKRFIPIFIDTPTSSYNSLRRLGKVFPIYYVISHESYERLSIYNQNVRFLPFSVPEIWKQDAVPDKQLDVLQIGRKNPLLHKWMLRMASENGIEYVYQRIEDGILNYWSTKRGLIGDFRDREKYIDLLRSARVSLVSTGGIDGSRKDFDINPVTVRFFESAVNYCYMIGRYPRESKDFEYTRMSEIVIRVDEEESFRKRLIDCLDKPFDLKKEYDSVISSNATRHIALVIERDLEKCFEKPSSVTK